MPTSTNALRAVDTNVLLRLLLGDNAQQTASAEAFVASGAIASQLALAEAIWVLRSRYGRAPAELADAIELLAAYSGLEIEGAATVTAAVALFRQLPHLGFTDCLLLEQARASGHLPLGTFDRELAQAPGAMLLTR